MVKATPKKATKTAPKAPSDAALVAAGKALDAARETEQKLLTAQSEKVAAAEQAYWEAEKEYNDAVNEAAALAEAEVAAQAAAEAIQAEVVEADGE